MCIDCDPQMKNTNWIRSDLSASLSLSLRTFPGRHLLQSKCAPGIFLSEVWDVPRLESSQDKHWQQITTPGCSEDPVALSVITTLIKGCCELNSNGYKISVLTFLQFFTDFAKQLLTTKFAQTRSNWLFQSAIKNILMPERNDFILSSRNIWEIFPGGFEEISSYYLNQKKLM